MMTMHGGRPLRARPLTHLRQLSARPARWKLWLHGAPAAAGHPSGRDPALTLVEATLFAADEPLPARKLAVLCGLAGAEEARRLVRQLMSLYDEEGTAFQVAEIASGYQLLTRPEYDRWISRLAASPEPKLSAAARETLAIVAYRQPITRADLEGIRGVQCGDLLRQLMEKNLVRIAGREQTLGRPVLYGTTKEFLKLLGLKSLSELPGLKADAGGEPVDPSPS